MIDLRDDDDVISFSFQPLPTEAFSCRMGRSTSTNPRPRPRLEPWTPLRTCPDPTTRWKSECKSAERPSMFRYLDLTIQRFQHSHWGSKLASQPAASGLIPSIPEIFSDEKLNEVKVNQWQWLEESGQWLENVIYFWLVASQYCKKYSSILIKLLIVAYSSKVIVEKRSNRHLIKNNIILGSCFARQLSCEQATQWSLAL